MDENKNVQRKELAHLLVAAMLSEPVTHEQAFGVLHRLGVLNGSPDELVTKGELAEVLLKVLPL